MGCANSTASMSPAKAKPQTGSRQPENGGGSFVELGIELPDKLVGKDAATYKTSVLPNGIFRDRVPAVFEKFLTSQAWVSIHREIVEQEWECNTGDQVGSSLADRLAMQYKPLKFSFKKCVYYEPIKRAPMGSMDVLVFKIVIDTASAEPPAQPLTAQSINVVVPSDNEPGAPFEVEHPETKAKVMIKGSFTAGSQIKWDCSRGECISPQHLNNKNEV